MDIFNDVGTAEHEEFVAVFLAPEIISGGVAELNIRAHRTVVDHDALTNGLEKISHRAIRLMDTLDLVCDSAPAQVGESVTKPRSRIGGRNFASFQLPCTGSRGAPPLTSA